MNPFSHFQQIIERYRSFDWIPRKILLSPTSRLDFAEQNSIEEVEVADSEIDAIWFSRPAAGGREAWELRVISDSPYALFEMFEADESDEARQDVRTEMEARLREHLVTSLDAQADQS